MLSCVIIKIITQYFDFLPWRTEGPLTLKMEADLHWQLLKISKYCVIIFIITRDEQILCDYKNNHTIFQKISKYGVIIFIITRDEQFSYDYLYNHTG